MNPPSAARALFPLGDSHPPLRKGRQLPPEAAQGGGIRLGGLLMADFQFHRVGGELLELFVLRREEAIRAYDLAKIEALDWSAIDIRTESQGKERRTDSIQYAVIQRLRVRELSRHLFDDDGPGEVADVVAIRRAGQTLNIELYHCKYSSAAAPGARGHDLDHRERAEVHVDAGTGHVDDRALAVGDDDADVAHRDHGAGRGLDQDAAGRLASPHMEPQVGGLWFLLGVGTAQRMGLHGAGCMALSPSSDLWGWSNIR